MAASVPLSAMRTSVRELADEEETQQNRISAAELDRRINEALRELYDLLISTRGQEYYVRSHTITTAAGTNNYQVPADFYQLVGLLAKDGAEYRELQPWGHADLPRLMTLENSSVCSLDLLRYRLQGGSVEMRPAPQKAYTITMRYVPTCPTLSLPSDSFDGVNGWEKWAYLRVAIDLLTKDEQDSRPLETQLGVMTQRIRAHAGNRDAGQPEVVADTRRDGWAGEYLDDWNR